MKRSKVLRGLAVLGTVGAMTLTAACGGGGSSDKKSSGSEKPLQIFLSQGTTGLLAPSTKAVQRGIDAAVTYLNDQGGINGRKIEVTKKDNQSDPTRGVTLVTAAVNSSKKPDLVIPGVSSAEALAVAPLLSRSKVVGLSPASSSALNDPKKYPYFFSQSALEKQILDAVATTLKNTGKVKKVALVAPDDALGDALGDEMKGAFAKVNITTTDNRYPADGVDFTAAFQKALSGKPDYIYMEGSGTEVPHLLVSRVKAGAEKTPTIAGVVAGSQPLLTLAKGTNQMENVALAMLPTQSYVAPADRSAQFNAFYKGVTAQGPLETTLSTYGAGWDCVKIWADAVKQVKGDVTGPKIRESLMHLPASDDRLFYKKSYTPTDNYFNAQADEFVIAVPTGVKDGMFTYKSKL